MYCAYIMTIKEIRKHSNADRLQCRTISEHGGCI